MESNSDTLAIIDESSDEEQRYCLYIDGGLRGAVTKNASGRINFHWHTAGPCQLQESKVWIQGLLELSVIGDLLKTKTKINLEKHRA